MFSDYDSPPCVRVREDTNSDRKPLAAVLHFFLSISFKIKMAVIPPAIDAIISLRSKNCVDSHCFISNRIDASVTIDIINLG